MTHENSRQSTTPPQAPGRNLSGELEPYLNPSSITSHKEAKKEKSFGAKKAAYDETKSSSSFKQKDRNDDDDDDLTARSSIFEANNKKSLTNEEREEVVEEITLIANNCSRGVRQSENLETNRKESEEKETTEGADDDTKTENSSVVVNNVFSCSDISVKRQKFVRQKSFDLESEEETEMLETLRENSVKEEKKRENLDTSSSKRVVKPSRKVEIFTKKVESSTQTFENGLNKTTTHSKVKNTAKSSTKVSGSKKRPDLTIKIYDSSFDMGNPDTDPISEAFRSPSLHISGISINRSPTGPLPPPQSASLSPKYQVLLPPGANSSTTPGVLTVNAAVNRNRYRFPSLYAEGTEHENGSLEQYRELWGAGTTKRTLGSFPVKGHISTMEVKRSHVTRAVCIEKK